MASPSVSASATIAPGPAAVEGKIPAPAPNVPDAYLFPPKTRIKTVSAPPGRGSKVTTFQTSVAIPPREQNQYWQQLERGLGVTLEPTLSPSGAAYEEKLAALIASNDLPDLVFLTPPPGTRRLIQQGAFTDLTPFLTGAALQEFPNLAAFPPLTWKNVAINGKFYGVPRPRVVPGEVINLRQDWADKFGGTPKNADEFFNLIVNFTKGDPDGNGRQDTWGLTMNTPRPHFVVPFFNWMYRGASNWRLNPDGSLVKDIETEEYKQAIAFARRLWEAGVYHPDAATMTNSQLEEALFAGKVGAVFGGTGSLTNYWARLRELNPAARLTGLKPFGHDGGAATYTNSTAYSGFTAIPARVGRDPERVRELLRVINYLAAPFGSEEWWLKQGVEGVHYTLKPDGSPVVTDAGRRERGGLDQLTFEPPVAFYSTLPAGAAQEMQGLLAGLVALAVPDPSLGFFSATGETKSGELAQLQADRLAAIVAGREPLSAWDTFVKDWRSRGGDQIRKELEEARRA